tara:strand:+ start:73 stop:348 length:276 start_codon:yes stop_codon:yes gene_type:complete
MPEAQLKKAKTAVKAKPIPKLKENTALVESKGSKLEVPTIHALTVLEKQGWEVLDYKADVDYLIEHCDSYELKYPPLPSVSQLVEIIRRGK